MIKINSHCYYVHALREKRIGCKVALTAGLYVVVESAYGLMSLFQQNKTNVSFSKIARLTAIIPFC